MSYDKETLLTLNNILKEMNQSDKNKLFEKIDTNKYEKR